MSLLQPLHASLPALRYTFIKNHGCFKRLKISWIQARWKHLVSFYTPFEKSRPTLGHADKPQLQLKSKRFKEQTYLSWIRTLYIRLRKISKLTMETWVLGFKSHQCPIQKIGCVWFRKLSRNKSKGRSAPCPLKGVGMKQEQQHGPSYTHTLIYSLPCL